MHHKFSFDRHRKLQITSNQHKPLFRNRLKHWKAKEAQRSKVGSFFIPCHLQIYFYFLQRKAAGVTQVSWVTAGCCYFTGTNLELLNYAPKEQRSVLMPFRLICSIYMFFTLSVNKTTSNNKPSSWNGHRCTVQILISITVSLKGYWQEEKRMTGENPSPSITITAVWMMLHTPACNITLLSLQCNFSHIFYNNNFCIKNMVSYVHFPALECIILH